jgi:uncharacterized XkdX family phage protein
MIFAFDSVQRLYANGRIDKEAVARAVVLNLIDAEQYKQITGENYPI